MNDFLYSSNPFRRNNFYLYLYILSIACISRMHSLTGGMLIDFQNMPGTDEEKDYHKQVYGAIKLHLSEMEKYEKTSHFVSCKNCKMVLTQEVSLFPSRIRSLSMIGRRSVPTRLSSKMSSRSVGRSRRIWWCGFAVSASTKTCWTVVRSNSPRTTAELSKDLRVKRASYSSRKSKEGPDFTDCIWYKRIHGGTSHQRPACLFWPCRAHQENEDLSKDSGRRREVNKGTDGETEYKRYGRCQDEVQGLSEKEQTVDGANWVAYQWNQSQRQYWQLENGKAGRIWS